MIFDSVYLFPNQDIELTDRILIQIFLYKSIPNFIYFPIWIHASVILEKKK
jgi:hypothetical protein